MLYGALTGLGSWCILSGPEGFDEPWGFAVPETWLGDALPQCRRWDDNGTDEDSVGTFIQVIC